MDTFETSQKHEEGTAKKTARPEMRETDRKKINSGKIISFRGARDIRKGWNTVREKKKKLKGKTASV